MRLIIILAALCLIRTFRCVPLLAMRNRQSHDYPGNHEKWTEIMCDLKTNRRLSGNLAVLQKELAASLNVYIRYRIRSEYTDTPLTIPTLPHVLSDRQFLLSLTEQQAWLAIITDTREVLLNYRNFIENIYEWESEERCAGFKAINAYIKTVVHRIGKVGRILDQLIFLFYMIERVDDTELANIAILSKDLDGDELIDITSLETEIAEEEDRRSFESDRGDVIKSVEHFVTLRNFNFELHKIALQLDLFEQRFYAFPTDCKRGLS
ncbi:uncharacterized protein [Ptychodera flava]|uniref:uncharacterized protein n=1 Tax=Ptychodera flava TaxID=63121 RepID=UPI00396A39ED